MERIVRKSGNWFVMATVTIQNVDGYLGPYFTEHRNCV